MYKPVDDSFAESERSSTIVIVFDFRRGLEKVVDDIVGAN